MERKAMQTATGTGREGSCCACGEAVLNWLSQVFRVVLGRVLLHRASRMTLMLVLGVAVVLCGAGLAFAQLADSPWPMRGHDARHTGQSLYKGPVTANLKWEFKTGGSVFSSPVIGSDGTVYVGSSDNHLYAINRDGSLKWKFKTEDDVSSSPAVESDGTIYAGSKDNYLYAITPDGSLKWKFETGDDVWSSPAIGPDGTVYVGSGDNYLYALNPDGSLKWKFKTGDWVASSSAIGADGTVYVGSIDDYLYAVNPDGSLKWKFKTRDAVTSSPATGADGTVYVGSWDNYLYAVTPDGSLKWKFKTGNDVTSSPAISSDGTIYAGSEDNYHYALNPDGSLKWKFKTGWEIYYSSPAIDSDGTVYVGSGFNVYAFLEVPNIVISEMSLNFGFVEVASSKQLTFTILNDGGAPLSVTSITSSSPEFVVFPTSFTVAVDSSQEVMVTFTPSSAEGKLATLTIASNDPDRQTVTVSLRGNITLADFAWPMIGHDAKHTGQSPYKGPGKPELKWKFRTGGSASILLR